MKAADILIAKLIATASKQIGMFLVILTVVSAAIVAFIIYTMTLGKIREIEEISMSSCCSDTSCETKPTLSDHVRIIASRLAGPERQHIGDKIPCLVLVEAFPRRHRGVAHAFADGEVHMAGRGL